MNGAGRARWGWLATTLGLGLAVVASAWTSYRSAAAAAGDLTQSQGQILREAALAGMGRPDGSAGFDSVVRAKADAGLRFAAMVDSAGRYERSGGTPSTPIIPPPPSFTSPTLLRLGNLVRGYYPPPPPPAERSPRSEPPPDGDPNRPPPGPRNTRTLVIEFEPVVATAIAARAGRTLAIAAAGALVLVGAGLGFWRLSARLEAGERRMEAHRRLTALGEMSAVLAHEIRNPLASLKGHAQLLLERLPSTSAEHRNAERVVEGAQRLEVLTSDLLDFARTGPMDIRPVDPSALLRDAVDELPDSPIVVTELATTTPWPLDARRIREAVLGNLLRNAVQASPPERPVRASVSIERGRLVFAVRDFGPGLPPGDEERIFDPFFTTRTTGTGLGLPVARRIVEMHGGTLTAETSADGGALFRVELPRAES